MTLLPDVEEAIVDLFLLPTFPEIVVGAFEGGAVVADWLTSAFDLIGDVLDPILPGGAGSELRPTSSTVTAQAINRARAQAGLSPLIGRRRRKRALTNSDKADIAFIAATLGKPAGKDFAMIVAARSR